MTECRFIDRTVYVFATPAGIPRDITTDMRKLRFNPEWEAGGERPVMDVSDFDDEPPERPITRGGGPRRTG